MRCFASVAVFFVADIAFRRGFMKKNFFYGIDVFKLLCAVLIVCIHTAPLESLSTRANSLLVNCFCRVAVPFFFVSSGFLVFKKVQIGQNFGFSPIWKYVKKILWLYLFWSAVYFPFTAARIYRNRGTGAALSIFLDWLKNMVFSAGYGFLWYLPATAAAVLAVGFLLKKRVSINAVLAIGFCLYLVGLCGQSYFGLVRQIPHSPELSAAVKSVYDFIGTTRNGIFEGFVFIALGAKLSQKENFGTLKKSAAGLALSLILLCGEFALVSKMRWRLEFDMYLMLLPCAWFMLKTALCFRPNLPEKLLRLCRPYSSLIYFTHMLFIDGYCLFTRAEYTDSFLMFAIGLLPALLVSTAVILLSGKKHFSFLKKIY